MLASGKPMAADANPSPDDLFTQIENLLGADWFQRLVQDDRRYPRYWSVIHYGEGSYEIRYSMMLRWLLDPTETHRLGAFVARELALEALSPQQEESARALRESLIAANDISHADAPVDGTADTEALKASGGIDVLYSEKDLDLCLAIENKMGSDEHAGTGDVSQLAQYYQAVEGDPRYQGLAHRLYLFLTGDGHAAPSLQGDVGQSRNAIEAWVPISCEQLNAVLLRAIERLEQLRSTGAIDDGVEQRARIMIEDFIYDNRRHFQSLRSHARDLEPFRPLREVMTTAMEALGMLPVGDEAQEDPRQDEMREAIDARFGDDLSEVRRALELIYPEITLQEQDHTPFTGSQRLIRTMFNRLVAPESRLSMDESRFGRESKEKRLAQVTMPALTKHGITTVRLTSGKGQGLNLLVGDNLARIYFSADGAGMAPNDGCTMWTEDRSIVRRVLTGPKVSIQERQKAATPGGSVDPIDDLADEFVAAIAQGVERLSTDVEVKELFDAALRG